MFSHGDHCALVQQLAGVPKDRNQSELQKENSMNRANDNIQSHRISRKKKQKNNEMQTWAVVQSTALYVHGN